MNKPVLATMLGLALLAWTTPAPAQYFPGQLSARAQAMGGAYAAAVEDAFALYWNPGAMGGRDVQEVNSAFGNVYASDLSSNLLVYQVPFRFRHGVGVGWQNGGQEDGELKFNSNQFTLGYGYRFDQGLGIGANATYLREGVDLDNGQVSAWSGWSTDIGVHYKWREKLYAAAVVRNAFKFDVSHENGTTENLLSPADGWVLGLAGKPVDGLTLAADLDDRFHLGAEYMYRGLLGAQAGIQRQVRNIFGESSDGNTYSLGVSARVKGFKFDVAHILPPVLPSSTRFSLGFEFSLSPSKVAIDRTEVDNVYASQSNRYSDNPVGTAKLVSKSDEPLAARVGLYVPDYMAAPTETEVILRPKETKEVDLNAIFSPEILMLQEDRPARAEVLVSYQTKNRTRTERARTQLFIYRPGAISWNDLRAAAAYVTVQDPTISEFARTIAMDRDQAGQGASLRNLYTAMWVFNALGEYGITYVPDPNNPFTSISEDREAVDQVQYPRQLLTSRTGDCDDTSVLYCSMLENLGVPTAFLDGPGHILMLFDTGLHARNAEVMAVDEYLYVIRGDRVWIPVETTLIGRPFTEAWLEGAAIWSRWADNPQSRFVEMQEAWQEYQPVLPPGEAPSLALPEMDVVQVRVTADIDSLRLMQQRYLEEKFLKPLEESQSMRGELDTKESSAHDYSLHGPRRPPAARSSVRGNGIGLAAEGRRSAVKEGPGS